MAKTSKKTKKTLIMKSIEDLLKSHRMTLAKQGTKAAASTIPGDTTLSGKYIGSITTYSWVQVERLQGLTYWDRRWDTVTLLTLYHDADCKQVVKGELLIYNGKDAGDNSSLIATADAAYLAKAPVELSYGNVVLGLGVAYGLYNAIYRVAFERCTPCGCK